MVVVQWLGKHEEFILNPFYVGGDSYSGKVVPAVVQEISKGMYGHRGNMMDDTCNHQCFKPPINLQVRRYFVASFMTYAKALKN